MGQDTVGTLCYGIDLGEDLPWDVKVWEETGFHNLIEEDFGYCLAYILGDVEYDPDKSAKYLSKVRRATGGLEILVHLDLPDQRYILTFQNTKVQAFNGIITTLSFESLNKKALASKEKLKDAFKKLGGKGSPKPSWLLTSDYC